MSATQAVLDELKAAMGDDWKLVDHEFIAPVSGVADFASKLRTVLSTLTESTPGTPIVGNKKPASGAFLRTQEGELVQHQRGASVPVGAVILASTKESGTNAMMTNSAFKNLISAIEYADSSYAHMSYLYASGVEASLEALLD